MLNDRNGAKDSFCGGRAVQLEHAHRALVRLPTELAGSSQTLPGRRIARHCSTAHRKGLHRLGGGVDADVAPYVRRGRVQDYPFGVEQPVFDAFQAARGDPELLRPVPGAERD